VRCELKLQNDLSELSATRKGQRQGDALAFMLFNTAFERKILGTQELEEVEICITN
jgi:hypothetical protein